LDQLQADRVIEQLTSIAETLTAEINRWFDSMMDRVSQRFVVQARIWTVAFSVLVAFALHLDAFNLFTTLSSDSELRARLITSADALTKKADEILAISPDGGNGVYVLAMRQLIKGYTNELRSLPAPA